MKESNPITPLVKEQVRATIEKYIARFEMEMAIVEKIRRALEPHHGKPNTKRIATLLTATFPGYTAYMQDDYFYIYGSHDSPVSYDNRMMVHVGPTIDIEKYSDDNRGYLAFHREAIPKLKELLSKLDTFIGQYNNIADLYNALEKIWIDKYGISFIVKPIWGYENPKDYMKICWMCNEPIGNEPTISTGHHNRPALVHKKCFEKAWPSQNPFKSEAQRRYLWTHHPDIARRWAHEGRINPSDKTKAIEHYKLWHHFEPTGEIIVDIPNNAKHLKVSGKITRLDYESNKDVHDKGSKQTVYYYHHFHKNHPYLAVDNKGRHHILGNVRVHNPDPSTGLGLGMDDNNREQHQSLRIGDWNVPQVKNPKMPRAPKKVTKLGRLAIIEYKPPTGKKALLHGDSGEFVVGHPDGHWLYIARLERRQNPRKPRKHKNPGTTIPASVKAIMPEMQQRIVRQSDEFVDIVARLDKVVSNIPRLYGAEKIPIEQKVIHLHYFYGGSDWYIAELGSKQEPHIAYGYTVLNQDWQNAEWGYISINELKATNRIELDFHWRPRMFIDIPEAHEPESHEPPAYPEPFVPVTKPYRVVQPFGGHLAGDILNLPSNEDTRALKRQGKVVPVEETVQPAAAPAAAPFPTLERITAMVRKERAEHKGLDDAAIMKIVMDHIKAGERNPKKNQRFIVTAPHAEINPAEPHPHDWAARDVAIALSRRLGAQLHLADRPRAKGDLNRPSTRGTAWRKDINRSIQKGDVLLDIHSYPASTDTDNWYQYDFVVLKSHGAADPKLIVALVENLHAEGFRAEIAESSVKNDIVETAAKRGARAVLIEVNEGTAKRLGAEKIAGVLESCIAE